jgi:hypothetical protein
MNNILILREFDLKHSDKDWRYLTKSFNDIANANLVILIKNDGTYELVKNRNGSNGLIGKCGELLDTNTFLETDSKFPKPVNLGIEI